MAHDPHGGHDGSLDYHRRMLGDVHRVAAYERAHPKVRFKHQRRDHG